MRISHRIFLLFGIPLFVELFLLGALIFVQVLNDEATEKEIHSRKLASLGTMMLCKNVDWAHSIFDFRQTALMEFSNESESTTKDLQKDLKYLQVLCHGDAEEEQIAKRLEIGQERMLSLTGKFLNADMQFGDEQTVLLMKPLQELSDLLELEKRDMMKIVRIEEEKQKILHEHQQNFRNLLYVVLGMGVVVAVFANLAVAVLLNRSIADRLKVMVDNTGRLAARKDLAPVTGGDDEIAELDRSFHDMEDRLRELEAQKQSFLAMVTHDLRTPLTSVMLFLELLTRKKMTLEVLSEKSSRIYDSVARLVDMVNNLLDMEKIEAAKFEIQPTECELQDLIGRSFASLDTYADSKEIKMTSTAPPVTLVVDGERVIQVLVNLLGNAIKFAPDRGLVEVDAKVTGDSVRISVSDNGPGIEREAQGKIFNRFEQARAGSALSGSSGLGLSVAKALVELHGGSIGVDSVPGEGTQFWFILPLVTKDASQ